MIRPADTRRHGLLLVVSAAVAAASGASGQAPDTMDVTGVVGDVSTGQPIAGALVEIPDLERRTITTADGRFVFFNLPPGPHRLRVEMLGYTSWEETTELEHLDLLRIGLLPRPVVLENIRVTVDRLDWQRRTATSSVVAVEREELLRSPYGDVARVIQMGLLSRTAARPAPCSGGPMPRLQQSAATGITELCLMWRGRVVRPKILVDDVATQFVFLTTYQPSEIYAVEFYEGGLCLRIYTNAFIERGRRVLPPAVSCMR